MTAGQAGDGALDAAVALLAERVSQLAERAGELTARVDTAEAGLRGIGQSVAEAASLARQVEDLSEAVAALGEGRTGPPGEPGGHPRVWARMSDEESVEALRDLGRWVTAILLRRYPHAAPVLAPCWPAHPAVVEELDWLYWEWTGWATADGRSRDAADWHDRWLPGVLARAGPHLRPCAERGEHVKPAWRRPVPDRFRHPDYWPELLFIEEMGRARRASGERPPQ